MALSTLTVAAIQLSSQDDVAQNLVDCQRWVEAAARAGAKLVVLPENFAYFGPDARRMEVAEPLAERTPSESAPIQSSLGRWARELEITIVGGGMPIQSRDRERPFNTAVVFGPDGQLAASYHKI